jgi:hypothetical protein
MYDLSFLYVSRPNYSLNNLQIFFDNFLIDIITSTQTSWTEYNISFPISTSGTYSLIFQGQSNDIEDANIAITNIRLFEPPSLIGGATVIYNNKFKSTVINGSLGVIDYVSGSTKTLGQITSNYLTLKNNLTMPADSTQSIFFKDISSNIIGRIFASNTQMFCDYHNIMSFRYCDNKSNIIKGYKLNLTSSGIIINSYFNKTSTYNLDCYGTAIIRGQLTVSGDILYSTSGTSLTTRFSNIDSYSQSISGRVNSISGNIVSISGLINSISGNIVSISGLVNTNILNISSISGLVNSISGNIVTISGLVNSISGKINSISGTVNSINSAATYSSASILANGFVRATRFELTNRLDIIYQSTIIGTPANYPFPSATEQTIPVSNLPAGLYIMCFSLFIGNGINASATFSSIRFQLTSSNGFSYYEEYDYHAFTLPALKTTNFSRTCMINNSGIYNFTLRITPTYTGSTGLYWVSTSGNYPANKTFLQFTRIG